MNRRPTSLIYLIEEFTTGRTRCKSATILYKCGTMRLSAYPCVLKPGTLAH
jgi:CTP synthase (UTP-ammonia lyase)